MRDILNIGVLLLALLAGGFANPVDKPKAQTADANRAEIRVDLSAKSGPFNPAWSWFGYDEPNYTYAPHGKKLLKELAALHPAPVYIRTHNLLTTGDGSSSLKWGSTNAYTEDANGNPIYNWKIMDRIFDTYRDAHLKPLAQIGFMPEALSVQPQPYRHSFPNGSVFTGWTYPPKSYEKWGALVYEWVRHMVKRYGKAEVETWPWEVWNEPDIAYWHGSREAYFKLYDFAADAVKRALPTARVGGPDCTGGAYDFLRAFLEHCRSGKNYATGKIGSPLEFISFHPKGSPRFLNGHVQMGLDRHLQVIDRQFEVIASFPEFRSLPVVLGESDPEGCAACSAATHPENGYRETPLFATYTAEALHGIYALAEKRQINLQGIVTWSFTFENTPYFAGYRELATNGIDKPVLNVFRMFGKMAGQRIGLSSDRRVKVEDIQRVGVRDQADINGIATTQGKTVSALVWHYHDDDLPAPDAPISFTLAALPANVHTVTLRRFVIDSAHSNAYEVWKKMGSPQPPSPAQFKTLETAGRLGQTDKEANLSVTNGVLHLNFNLPRNAVSLLQFSWN